MNIDNSFIVKNCIPSSAGSMRPFEYQFEGIKTLFQKKTFLISDDPGLGKTMQLIVAANLVQHFAERPIKVLVLCVKSIVINWQREIYKWASPVVNFTVANNDKMITNSAEKMLLKKWDIVIADESHFYLKNPNTQRAKMFLQIIANAERTWLSTATPASKCASDYYVTLKVLLPVLFEKWSMTQFKKRYCAWVSNPFTPMGGEYKGFNQKNIEELNKVFSKCALGRKQEEVKKDLPELTFSDYFADVQYKDLKGFTPEEALEIKKRVTEGEEIGSHYQEVMQAVALLKVPSVVDLVNTYPDRKKIVVFVWHRSVADKLVEELVKAGRRVGKITGEVSSAVARQKIIDDFQSPGEESLNTLVLNMQSGGVGINLTAASTGIYVQYPGSVTHWVQSMKRIHRIGSKEPVHIIKVMTKGSIDEDIFSLLMERYNYIERVGLQAARGV